jgi:fermentation-respiration switch protein FrsA (DUF1100 family)
MVTGLLAAGAVAYLLLVAALWYWQATFIFRPSQLVDVTPADLGVKFDSVTLPIGADRLAGWWVPSEVAHAKTLLYLHGNAGNVAVNVHHVLRLRSVGLNVLIVDYRGYGESTGGPPREQLVYEDAERAWSYLVLERKIPPADIVIYGHSLGGGIAIDLASKHPQAGGLITEGTFTAMADMSGAVSYAAYVPVRLILTERFDSISKVRSIRVPKLFLQGEDDLMTLPMARRLYEAAAEPKQLAVIPRGGHEDAAEVNPTDYFRALNSFLARYGFIAAGSE